MDPVPQPRFDSIAFWEDKFSERESHALAAAHEIDGSLLDGNSVELLIDAIVNDFAAEVIVPKYDEFRIETRDSPRAKDAPSPITAQPLEVIFILPCRGAARLLMSDASRVVNMTRTASSRYEVMITLALAGDSDLDDADFTDSVAQLRAEWFEQISKATITANTKIAEHRDAIRAAVAPVARQRHFQRRLVSQAASALNIPLDRVSAAPTIPLEPRILNLATVEAAASAGGDEEGLAVEIADALVDLIRSFSTALERTPVTASKLLVEDEESVRDVLLFLLNANWKGTVSAETFLGEGKTDILLRWRNRDAFIGECKIWKGKRAFDAGLDQLLDKYTVWRATRVAMILFIRERADVTSVIEKARETIRSHARCIGPSGTTLDAYLMKAQHDQRKIVTLELISVVLPTSQSQIE